MGDNVKFRCPGRYNRLMGLVPEGFLPKSPRLSGLGVLVGGLI